MKGIHRKLKKYLKPSKLIKLMWLEIDSKEKKNLKNDLTVFNIRHHIIENMNWKIARTFIEENLIVENIEPEDEMERKEQARSRKEFQMRTMKRLWGDAFDQYTKDLSNREFYASFFQTAIESIKWLEAKFIEKISEYAAELQQEINREFV